MPKCTDPDLGALLQAYELKALSEEDLRRVRAHLLECDHCIKQLKSFHGATTLLHSDREVRKLIRQAAQAASVDSTSVWARLWGYLWPDTPLVLKPALLYVLIVLLILPSYKGLMMLTQKEKSGIQVMSLIPSDRLGYKVFRLDPEIDNILEFSLRGEAVGQVYQVVIRSEDGDLISLNSAFRFNSEGIGWVKLPESKMAVGNYKLVVSNPEAGSQAYWFRIEK